MLKKLLVLLFVAKAAVCSAQNSINDVIQISPTQSGLWPILDVYFFPDSSVVKNSWKWKFHDGIVLKPTEFKSFRAYAVARLMSRLKSEVKHAEKEHKLGYYFAFTIESPKYFGLEGGEGGSSDQYLKELQDYAKKHNSSGTYNQVIASIAYLRFRMTRDSWKHRWD
ncbi:MAG: hypothetical protein ACRYFX_22890 [Janthinobacterium lividum]